MALPSERRKRGGGRRGGGGGGAAETRRVRKRRVVIGIEIERFGCGRSMLVDDQVETAEFGLTQGLTTFLDARVSDASYSLA